MSALRVEISKELHKRLKMRALQDDTSLQRLVPFALDAWLSYDAQKAKTAHKAQIIEVKSKVTKGT